MRQTRARLGLCAALACAVVPLGARAAEYVIHISVDGLSGILLQSLIASDTDGSYANFARFVAEGATTFDARADYTHTITLPNHTSMLTGRPVSQPSGWPNTSHHGYTSNVDPPPGTTLHNAGNPNLVYVASAFDVVHDHGKRTALYASKSKFVLFEWSYDAVNGAPDALPPDDGTDKIDTYVNLASASMQSALLAGIGANHFHYVFVHYADPDTAGHASGWGSAAWNAAVHTVDGYLGALFALVEGDPVLHGHTLILLSADHGGTGSNHTDATDPANYTIPFLVWGQGVAPGADLYVLNAGTRADPGGGRPSYTAPLQPIRNGDGANLALAALSLPPVPGSSIDAAQDLAIGSGGEIPLLPPLARGVLLLLLLAGGVLAARVRAPVGGR
jgi:hypothetical protein